jgi:hypothetical protein
MMLMLNRSCVGSTGAPFLIAAVVGLAFLFAGPAGAGTLYSWQTEDGNVSFTDNPKNIPDRYRDQTRTRSAKRLGDYERFTSQDAEGTRRYADQLAQRVDHLRRLNAERYSAPIDVAAADNAPSIRVNGMDLRLPATTDEAPVIVESVRVRSYGQIASRHDTVVRQGGRTLAILRGHQSGEVGGGVSIMDEQDLEIYR